MDEQPSPTRTNRLNEPEDMSSAESANSESSDDSSDDSDESGTESSQSEYDTNSNESDDSKSSINNNKKNNSYQAVKIDNQKDDEQIHTKKSQCDNNPSDQQNDDTDKESNEEDDSDDDQISRSKSTINFKKPPKQYYDQIVENFPDAIRRSSRSRKEPDRFQVETYDSDQSDSPKSNRKRRKRKDSDEWIDHNNHDGDHDDGDEFGGNDTESSEQDYKHINRRLRPKVRSKSNRNIRNNNRLNRVNSSRGTSTKHSFTSLSNSETEEDDDDDEDDDDNDNNNNNSVRKVSTSRTTSNRKKTSRRTVNPVSYKEESDSTDSGDLIEVEDTPDGSISGQAPVKEFEEEGEMIEKVLEHRLGRINATGPKTVSYQTDEHGDPNSNLTEEEPKEMHFLIKWKGWSYIHCTWESKDSLAEQKARGVKKIELYLKRDEDYKIWKKTASPEDIDYYEGQEELNCQLRQLHLNVERIIAHQPSKIDLSESCHPEYLCKWEGLPYGECTWEDGALINKLFSSKVDEYYQREKSQNIPIKFCRVLKQRPKFLAMKNQPSFIGGKDQLELRDYQLNGLNWLAQSWCRNNSVILADEMGLGKTIQTISFLNYLYNQHNLYGPFLLVVPLSTLAAWQKEFENWAPTMNVVVYIGDATSRHMIRQYEWSHPSNQSSIKFNVLLTTYEILLREKAFLSSISWAVLGVDEAHRLKNDESFLYKCLYSFHTNYRLLITGTPLQNSLRELWALLHFIMPDRFESWEDFESEHKDAYHHGFSKLHSQLQQFLLRRVKKDVEKSLPAKVEQILRVDMTSIQKQYYKWILTKNYKALSKGVKGSVTSFTNIIMELKKCCNHAGLVRPIDEYLHLDPLQKLIRGSGKLLLLDKLLCRLKETGHRVLIFSQMVRMLDILGDYLSLRRFPYQRLDGSIRGEFRKQALEHFNAEGSQDFCFLLSTRAGGLGINLATADTVIIFDSDWNPQNDLQAQARAHRIGQKNQVNIYRLVTRDSVEENIIERAKRKMVLDHLVIQRMDTSGHTVMRSNNSSNSTAPYQSSKGGSNNTTPFNKEELAAILKFGAGNLFNKTTETENGDEEPQCDIDEILKRAETREDDGPQTLGDELLSSFKVASFNFNEEEDVQALCPDDAANQKSWDEIIPESERLKFEQDERDKEEMKMMMLPRSRNKSNKMSGDRSDSGDEYDPMAKNDSPGSEDSDSERPRRRGRPKSSYKELIKGFSEQEVRRFIKSYKKFPTPLNRLESIAIDAELQEKPLPDLHQLAIELERNCHMAIKESEKDLSNPDGSVGKKNNRGPSFKLGGATVFARSILTNQKDLEPLDLMLPSNADERKKWMLTGIKVKSANWDMPWSIENDSRLLAGVYEYGLGNWEAIKMDPSYQLTEKILPDGELKPQAKQLQSRVEYLLKLMHRHLMSQQKQNEEPKTTKVKKPKSINEKMNSNSNNNNNNSNSNNIKMDRVESSNSTRSLLKTKERRKLLKDKEKHRKKRKEKKKDRKKEKTNNSSDLTSGDNCGASVLGSEGELGDEKFQECKEKMRAMKKTLKAFNEMEEQQQKLSKSQRKEAFYELVATIGAHIDSCLVEYQHDYGKTKEWRNNLWTFVARFTEFPAKKLYKFYRRIKINPSNRLESNSLRGDPSPPTASMVDGYHSGGGHESSQRTNANHHRTGNNPNVSIHGERRFSSGSAQKDSSNKRDYHSIGSGSGGPVKFAKHSHYPRDHHHSGGGRTLDYGHQSAYGHASSYYSVSGSSSKYDGYRNHSYDHGRYNNNINNTKNYYGRNDHHRSERLPPPPPPLIDRYDQRRSFHRNSNNEYRSGRNEMSQPLLMHSGGAMSHLNNGSAEMKRSPSSNASIVVNHSAAGLMTNAKVISNSESDINAAVGWPPAAPMSNAALLPTPLSLAPSPSINIHKSMVSTPNASATTLANIR